MNIKYKFCNWCKKEKPIKDFYVSKQGDICKKCKTKNVTEAREKKVMAILGDLIKQGIIHEGELMAAKLLYVSCESRINDCKQGNGKYNGVYCAYINPLAFMLDIIQNKPDMWEDWKRQTLIYMEYEGDKKEKNKRRPTIDRIDERKGQEFGYQLCNIQMLSKGDNSFKAQQKPHYLFNLNNGTSILYQTKKEAMVAIGFKSKQMCEATDSGEYFDVNGVLYLIQSKEVTEGKLIDVNKEFVGRYKMGILQPTDEKHVYNFFPIELDQLQFIKQ